MRWMSAVELIELRAFRACQTSKPCRVERPSTTDRRDCSILSRSAAVFTRSTLLSRITSAVATCLSRRSSQ